MLITQDSKFNPQFWDMVKALGAVGPRFQSSAGTMMERISSGEHLVGYNIFGSYAAVRAKKDPSSASSCPRTTRWSFARDVRVKTAKNPNAAKLWLDYILSKRGQKIIANQAELGSIRSDVEGEKRPPATAKTADQRKPIPVSADLPGYLDQNKRLDFLRQWKAAIKGGEVGPCGSACRGRPSSRVTALARLPAAGADPLPEPPHRAVLRPAKSVGIGAFEFIFADSDFWDAFRIR